MKIKITNNYYVRTYDDDLLGYMGEMNARTVEVNHPDVESADSYRLRLKYTDGAIYDVPIVDGRIIVTGSLLREAKEIECQWIATKTDGNNYELVAKSQIFPVRIGESISDDIAPIPSYEQSQSILDELNQKLGTLMTKPAVEGIRGQVIVANGDGTVRYDDISGAGYDDTEVRELIATNAQAIEALDENKADKSEIPAATSELTNDSGFVADENYQHTDNNFTTAEKQKLAGLSNYDDTAIRQLIAGKADTSAIPTKTSDLQNDSGYITQHQDISGKQDKSSLETDVKAFINASYIQSLLPIYNGGVE